MYVLDIELGIFLNVFYLIKQHFFIEEIINWKFMYIGSLIHNHVQHVKDSITECVIDAVEYIFFFEF